MRHSAFLKTLGALMLCGLFLSFAAFAQQGPSAALTNASIVKLVRAGFKEKTIIAIIHSRSNRFDLDPDRLIELKRTGVSENVILAMLAQGEASLISSDDWSDDSFFRGNNKRQTDKGSAESQSAESEIFGSSGGSKSETRERGMSGSNQGEGTTTGSATVRILRPPHEAGDAPPKLEKTPTLTNESIIKLVEAGFSEGTIIKRIEDSPAEFDLSPQSLDELRKRRVTAAIIAAMTVAMTDESGAKQTAPGKTREN